MRKLPIGIQSFEQIRQESYVYADKTKRIYDVVTDENGRYFFLSRPRRFGKSLLISTFKELFLGNKKLFEGLWISKSDYAWRSHPVIHLDFSEIASRTPDKLQTNLSWELEQIGLSYGLDVSSAPSTEAKFKLLVAGLAEEAPVVILIDEYDRPLLNHVNNMDVMREIQDVLRDFYTTIKAAGNKVQFLFMTGVTKFSKTSVFSGLNNLIDLTLLEEAADLLGYTEAEIDHYFEPHMQIIAKEQNISVTDVKDGMRYWYNGYQFSQKPEKVYNPFSVLMYLRNKDLGNYWFETGTPTFLVNLIRERKYKVEDVERAEINVDNLGSFDIDKMKLVPLLLQTGYLTFKGYNSATRNYRLGYPNEETKASFLLYFIDMVAAIDTEKAKNVTLDLTQALKNGNLERFFSMLKVFFASVPYNIQLPQEHYYQSIFYVILSLFGAYVQAEVVTNNGRIDCMVITDKQIYIFEFKLHGTAVEALEQIKAKKYYQKFLHSGKAIVLVGVAFDIKERNVSDWLSIEHT